MNLAGALLAVTLTVGARRRDTLELFTQFPPALETHPTNADHAFVGISTQRPRGVRDPDRAGAVARLRRARPTQFPGGFNCSESTPFNTPNVGGFSLERGSGSDARLAHDVELRARGAVRLRDRRGS